MSMSWIKNTDWCLILKLLKGSGLGDSFVELESSSYGFYYIATDAEVSLNFNCLWLWCFYGDLPMFYVFGETKSVDLV